MVVVVGRMGGLKKGMGVEFVSCTYIHMMLAYRQIHTASVFPSVLTPQKLFHSFVRYIDFLAMTGFHSFIHSFGRNQWFKSRKTPPISYKSHSYLLELNSLRIIDV